MDRDRQVPSWLGAEKHVGEATECCSLITISSEIRRRRVEEGQVVRPAIDTTVSGLPVASSALTSACCPVLPQALSVVTTTSSLFAAAATEALMSAWVGVVPGR